jgi:hypothetical protein
VKYTAFLLKGEIVMSEIKRNLSPKSLDRIREKKKSLTEESRNKMLKAGGSLKTNHVIDAQEICREVRDNALSEPQTSRLKSMTSADWKEANEVTKRNRGLSKLSLKDIYREKGED